MKLLDMALDCIRRGWYVFPCKPKTKEPMVGGGFKAATLDESQVCDWWTKWPEANVAIATGPSGLTVVDIDHGLVVGEDARDHGFHPTYAVRTGRRPEFGLQLYYAGGNLKSQPWARGNLAGDIRSATGYVMAAGSIHPDTGLAYEVWNGNGTSVPVPVPVTDFVRGLSMPAVDVSSMPDAVDNETAGGWKTWLYEYADHYGVALRGYEKRALNGWWLGIHCPWEGEHKSGAGAESSTVLGILDGKIAFECSHSTCELNKRSTLSFKWRMVALGVGEFGPEPGADPAVLLGTGSKNRVPTDWRDLFHTRDEVLNCEPPTFYIDQFLQRGSICALAAPVAQRKSLIALNMAHALCTGEPLFGVLKVVNRPSRVLYLCPEMGLISMSDRIRKIGLLDAVGDTFFIRSMNSSEDLKLEDIPEAALEGSVLIVDTAIRFIKGDEQGSSDAKQFSRVLFRVQNLQGNVGSIVVLYHSPKATKGAFELTLENCMRGSGEFGAAVTDAHGTRLQDTGRPYESASFISHLKQRDYKGLEDFEVIGEASGRLMAVGDPFADKVTLKTRPSGPKTDADGKEQAAEQVIQKCLLADPKVTADSVVAKLAELGILRKATWVKTRPSWKARKTPGSGAQHTESSSSLKDVNSDDRTH